MGYLLDYLKGIAVSDQAARRNAVLESLRNIKCPLVVYRDQIAGHWAENIVVRFGKGKRKLVIGAHYDSVEGSSGANDNGAGVCILFALIQRFLQKPPIFPIEFVFFDQEENERVGGKIYLRVNSPQQILGMINIDVCGYGNTIIIGPRKNLNNGLFGQAIQNVSQSGSHNCEIIELLPEGDDREFEVKGIPNISVAIVPAEDVKTVEKLALSETDQLQPKKMPLVMKTMHNGEMDNIDTVSEDAMEAVLQWIIDVLLQIEAPMG